MIVAFSGHRNLGGFKVPNPTYNFVKLEIEKAIRKLNPTEIITGMAIGTDQLVAEICIQLDVPFISAVPHVGQELYWTDEIKDKYFNLLSYAKEIKYVSSGGFASWKMQVRNEWMVNNSDILVAVIGKSATSGGTYNCVKYAKSINKKIIYINP
jgi:uncharacterized phage-like protein YoqJ